MPGALRSPPALSLPLPASSLSVVSLFLVLSFLSSPSLAPSPVGRLVLSPPLSSCLSCSCSLPSSLPLASLSLASVLLRFPPSCFSLGCSPLPRSACFLVGRLVALSVLPVSLSRPALCLSPASSVLSPLLFLFPSRPGPLACCLPFPWPLPSPPLVSVPFSSSRCSLLFPPCPVLAVLCFLPLSSLPGLLPWPLASLSSRRGG